MKNNHHKKRKMVVSFLLLMSLVAVLYSVSTQTNKIEAHPDRTLKTKKQPMEEAIIHAGEDYEYKIPKDAIEKVEADLPEGYVQGTSVKPNLMRNESEEKNLQSYSTVTNEGISDVKKLDDGTFLFLSGGRSDVRNHLGQYIGRTSYTVLFRVDEYGKELDHKLLSTGTNYDPSFNRVSMDYGIEAEFASSIIELEPERYAITYLGQRPGNVTYKPRRVTFSAPTKKNEKKIENFNWDKGGGANAGDISYAAAPSQTMERDQVLLGTNNTRLIKTGYWAPREMGGKEHRYAEIFEYSASEKKYTNRKHLAHPAYRAYYAPPNNDIGVWLKPNGLGRDKFSGGYYGRLHFSTFTTFPTQFRDFIGFWDSTGKLIGSIEPNVNETVTFLDKLSTDEVLYYTLRCEEATKLYKVNLENKIAEHIVDYPPKTIINIDKNDDTNNPYIFFAYVENAAGEFAGYVNSKSTVNGFLDKDFHVTNAAGIETKAPVNFSNFQVTSEGKYFVAGSTSDRTFANTPVRGWQTKRADPSSDSFFGQLLRLEDYSPAIKFQELSRIINLDDVDMDWDKELLQGVQVTDTFDLTKGKRTQDWLDARINRSPLKQELPIDWSALGLTKTGAGPQRIKYFITDSSMQTTASSRWINKITNQTVQENEYALDAQNFSIKLDEVETALNTDEAFKKRAKTMAWNSESHEIDEDSIKDVFSEEKVTINQAQLKELRQAKIAKPYPVDVTYRPNNKTTLVNRVWVFVTGSTTIVDANYVMYLDNYRLPLHEVATEDAEKIYTHSKVKVYKYNDAASEINDEPALQADKTTPELLQLKQEEVQALQQATPENADREDAFPLTIAFKDKEGKQVQGVSQVTVYHGKAQLQVTFVDEDGSEIHQAINREETVDSAIDLTQLNDIREATTMILSDGYELIEKPENEIQFMLPKEGKTVTYIFKGNVTLKSVTKTMHFTTGKVSPFAQSLSYDGTDKFKLDIVDKRGQKAPKEGYKRGQFSIQATLNQPFLKANNRSLKGAALIYEDGTETYEITSAGTEIYQSNQSQETKTYELMLDDKSNPNKGLRLYVPKGSNTETGTYTAEVTWELVEGP